MLSQLCRAKPLLKLSAKTNTNNKTPAPASELCVQSNFNVVAEPVNGGRDASSCQLEHCSFCDNRVCCLVNSIPRTEGQEGHATDSCIQKTENPAYGLFPKNWLVFQEMEALSNNVNNFQQGTEKNTEIKHSVTMNYVNISAHALASIPESRDEGTSFKISQNSSESQMKPDQNKSIFNNYLYPKSRQEDTRKETQHGESVIESSKTCDMSCDNIRGKHNENNDAKTINTRQKCSLKDKTLTLSIIKPHLKLNERRHQELLHSLPTKTKTETGHFRKPTSKEKYSSANASKQSRGGLDKVKQPNTLLGYDRLSEITSVKTEESIQEWLMRISEWVDSNSWVQGGCSDDDKGISNRENLFYEKERDLNNDTDQSNYDSRSHVLKSNSEEGEGSDPTKSDKIRETQFNINEILSKATKDSPANIPMVVMQCSRLHPQIVRKPPFQQTSLPMGTLVTALYQEFDWLYIQTPHGIEGFVSSSNCAPIGTMQKSNETKRPWEPCDSPVSISIKNTNFIGRQQQGSFVPVKLPPCGGKRTGPFVNMAKMKTSFYNDRHLNYAFKPNDSIKTAKTVTDILKSSPEMEINK